MPQKKKSRPNGGMPEYRHPRRGSIAAESASPGPANYFPSPTGPKNYIGYNDHVPTHHRSPCYSMGKKLAQDNLDTGPGPGAYDIRGNTRGGKDYIPGGTIARRYKASAADRLPGPGTYSPEKCTPKVKRRAPVAVMVGKGKIVDPMGVTPGPANYKHSPCVASRHPFSTKPNAPAYTISGREKFGEPWREDHGPGPNAYEVTPLERYTTRAPAYTQSYRDKSDRDNRIGPGPAMYYPSLHTWKKRAPVHSLGIKHSIYAGVVKDYSKDMNW